MINKIEISHKTIVFTVVLLLAMWLVFQIRDILFLLFISFILMTAIRPLVESMVSIKIPRIIAILFIYAVVFGFFGFSFAGAIPSLVAQSNRLVQELPEFISRVLPYW